MASGSRQDKEKAPMIPEEDIGTEKGELVDQDPPHPEAVLRSDRDRKRKQIAVEEDPLAVALRPAPDNKTETQRKQAIKDERYRQNSLFRHRWFQWFTQETVNRTPIEQKFSTPGSKKEVANFRSYLMELAVEAFLKEKENPDARPWETGVSEMSQRLARFLEKVPLKWGQIVAMKNEEEQDKWKTIAKMWMRWFATKKTITYFGSTSGKYKLCESVSDNTIRFISPEDSLTRTDETTRLGDGRTGSTHRVSIIDEELAEVLGHHEVVHYALKVMHLRFMHLHKWLHADIHKQNVLIHFPAWDWNQTKNRADSRKDKDNKPLKPVIIRSLVFVGIGDLGKAQTLKEVAKDFDPYPVDDKKFRPWIAPELNIHKAKKIDAENPFITKLSRESDIFALGWLIKELCGDYFTDMTDEERREYNRDARDKGLPYSDAADVHAQRLKEALDQMTWEKIRSPYGNECRTMDYWAHYFSEQLFIDPETCARPIERGPRAKAHPDGPQKVSRGNAYIRRIMIYHPIGCDLLMYKFGLYKKF
ncbi:hypothetical protein R1sor_004847 [Riccia sorocarpa]|uniref:Protein kinase domain-containing protein n=1 Tax=Riccia sorocarpa TaxID=122646 RepID=A0ABD3HM57_9MARC